MVNDLILDAEVYGDAFLQYSQHKLFEARSFLSSVNGCFSQGRTLGLLGVVPGSFASRLDQIGRHARLLIHCRTEDVEAVSDEARASAYLVDSPLYVLVGSQYRIKHRIRDISATTDRFSRLRYQKIGAGTSASDVRRIQVLQDRSGVTPIPGWVLRGFDGVTDTFIVIDYNDRIIAAVSMIRIRYGDRSAALGMGLCVATDWQGYGLATVLNALSIDHAFHLGVETVMEIVSNPSGASASVNRNCGLQVVPHWRFLFAEHRPHS